MTMTTDPPIPLIATADDRARTGTGQPLPPGHGNNPQRISQATYGRFRTIDLHITEARHPRRPPCQPGGRSEQGRKMSWSQICTALDVWRHLGGTALTILGGESSLHPDFVHALRYARAIGYDEIATVTDGLAPAARTLRGLAPTELSYVQISLDGGSHLTHDQLHGPGAFATTMATAADLTERGFDVRFTCTVSRTNRDDCLKLLDLADRLGIRRITYQALSPIGRGRADHGAALTPREWIAFYQQLPGAAAGHSTDVHYQPAHAYPDTLDAFTATGYPGCRGRTLDRISLFPDGRCYLCSALAGTDLHYATMTPDGTITLNRDDNEFDLFTATLTHPACGVCTLRPACGGGCPAETVLTGSASCADDPGILPVCRLWTTPLPT
uniref:radical SAM/SPASM domain-containing protein n=1 Tax=Protofrankia symbiont of Coriaria ruscifolia TaxID=1306542 RepID=UPI0010410B03